MFSVICNAPGSKSNAIFNSLYVCTVHVAELTIKLTLTLTFDFDIDKSIGTPPSLEQKNALPVATTMGT